jgi:hypothetical protein
VLLVVGSVALALGVLEAGYRLFHYLTLPERLYRLIDAQVPRDQQPTDNRQQFLPDAETGYVYAPNFEGRRGAPWHSRWRTNSHGHVSEVEYPQRKPAGEWRIAVIGDSMTANITNNVRWTEILERELNAAPAWRARVDGRFTRVINFGVDGYGMVQFAAMLRHRAMAFEPDLVLVNFISDDILRRKRFHSVPRTGTRRENIRAYLKQNFLDRIDWFGRCAELLNAILRPGRSKRCQLPLDPQLILAKGPAFHFGTRAEAVTASAAALSDMLAAAPAIRLLHMPLRQELEGRPLPQWRGLVEELRSAVPAAPIAPMLPRLQRDQPGDLGAWFFPDGHYTDAGTTIYAHHVARVLIEGDRP